MIADYFLWESVMMPDMFEEESGNSSGVQGGDCGYGDGIVSFQVWEFSDHVYGDHLPASIRDLVGDQLPHLLCREGLCPVACITSHDELGDIPGQPWPPVVP